MRKISPLIFVLFLLIISCSNKKKVPKGILPPPKMQAVLWDMVSAGEYLSGFVLNKDSIDRFAESSKIYGQVLQVHHISREEFNKSYLYYREHMDLMKVILDSLSKTPIAPEVAVTPEKDTLQKTDSVKLIDTLKQNAVLKHTDTLTRVVKLKPRRPRLRKGLLKKAPKQ